MDFTTTASYNDIKNFVSSLEEICYWSLMYMEAIILRRCGKNNFITFAENYLNRNKDASNLSNRISIYKKIA